MGCESYFEVIIAIGIDIKAHMKIINCISGLKKENGNVWVREATIENFATAKLILDWALILSYVLVNKAMIMFSKSIFTNIRNKISKKVEKPFFKGFQ